MGVSFRPEEHAGPQPRAHKGRAQEDGPQDILFPTRIDLDEVTSLLIGTRPPILKACNRFERLNISLAHR